MDLLTSPNQKDKLPSKTRGRGKWAKTFSHAPLCYIYLYIIIPQTDFILSLERHWVQYNHIIESQNQRYSELPCTPLSDHSDRITALDLLRFCLLHSILFPTQILIENSESWSSLGVSKFNDIQCQNSMTVCVYICLLLFLVFFLIRPSFLSPSIIVTTNIIHQLAPVDLEI